MRMVTDAISATAKTTLKPVVPRRKLAVLLKRTTPFLAPQMMMMNSIDMVTSASSSPITSSSSTSSFTQAGSASSEASVLTVNDTESDWSVTLEMNGVDVAFKVDTDAQCKGG